MPNTNLPSIEQLNAQAQKEKERRQKVANVSAVKMRNRLSPNGEMRDPHWERRVQFNAPTFTTPTVAQDDLPKAGLPEEWVKNYRNQKLGPNNEKLPPGAVGWTKYGEPYYGHNSPFMEFIDSNAWQNRVWKDLSNASIKELQQRRYDTEVEADRLLGEGKILPAVVTQLNAWGQTFTEILPKRLSALFGSTDAEVTPDNAGDISIAISRGLGNALMAFGLAIDHVGARPVKQAASVLESQGELLQEHGLEAATKGKDFYYQPAFENAINKMDDGFLKSATKWIQGLGAKFNPIDWTVNTFRVWKAREEGIISDEEFNRNTELAWNAGRVMYTSFIDPAAREEYKRRYLDGENPYLLELELENPAAEAAGEMLFDPTNFVFAGAKGKRVANTFEDSAKYMTKGMKPLEADIAKLTNVVEAVPEDLTHLAKQIDVATSSVDLQKLGKSKNRLLAIFDMSPQGQRNHLQRLSSVIISADLDLVAHNPDEFYHLLQARARLVSKDVAMRRSAIEYLMGAGVSLDSALSEGGLTFSKAVHGMYFDEAGELDRKFLDGMLEIIRDKKKTPVDKTVELTHRFDERFNKTIEKIFPLYTEKDALSAAERMLKPLEKVMKREGPVGKIYGWAAEKAAKVWLGWNAGFAARNYMSNKFHIFSDFGAEGLVESFRWKDSRLMLETIYGSDIPEFMQQGYGSLGRIVQPMKPNENIKFTDWINNNLKRSGIIEGRDRVAISAYALKTDWEQNGAKIVLNPTILRNEGVADEMIEVAQNILDLEYGNWERAYPKIVEALGEDMNAAKAFMYVDRDAKAWLREYHMMDFFVDGVRNAESKEDVAKIFQQIRDELRATVELGNGEEILPDLADGSQAGKEFLKEYQRYEKYSSNDALNSLMARHKTATENAEEGVASLFEDLQSYTGQLRKEDGTPVFDFQEFIDQDETEILSKIQNQTYIKEVQGRQKVIEEAFTKHIDALRKRRAGSKEIEEAYEALAQYGLVGRVPVNADPRDVATYIYENVWWPQQRAAFADSLDKMTGKTTELMSAIVSAYFDAGMELPESARRRFHRMFAEWQQSDALKGAIAYEKANGTRVMVKLTPGSAENYKAVLQLAWDNDVPTAYMKEGRAIHEKDHLINLIAQYTNEVYKDIRDIPLATAEAAFQARAEAKGLEYVPSAYALADPSDVGNTINKASKVYNQKGDTISNFVPFAEAMPELAPRIDRLEKLTLENWGGAGRGIADQRTLDALDKWGTQHVKPNRHTWLTAATESARRLGDFVLHDYGDQRNIDLILGMIYPYQFWYSRTYANWLKRVAQSPGIAAQYYRYKEYMAKIHAGLPDFYKYQINTNELFGMNSKHPFMFNLESTLSPLYAVTGEDFDDPDRRVNWWTSLADGLNRFGPSINPLLQYGIAIALMMQGEEEAASKWAGRMLPQSAPVQSLGALLGWDWLATTNLDPAVAIFSKGVDPYLRSRTGRAAYAMQEEGWKGYTPEEIFDAMRTQEGEIWDEAMIRALQDRGWGQLSSFFFGTGFKPRTLNDIEIDQMYQQLFSTINMRPNLSPSEYKMAMQELSRRYPYMDTVLVSKKIGLERDSAFAWSILGRIPPGASYDLYEMVGIDNDLIEKFYALKGDLTQFPESDRERFISAMIDMSAVLAIPDYTTQQEWDTARLYYSQMEEQIQAQFTDKINDKIDLYYALKDAGEDDQATLYLVQNPEVSQAMQLKTATIVNGPKELQAYYSSLQKIQQYYKGKVYEAARIKFGAGIELLQSEYFSLPPDLQKDFLEENPKLEDYWDFIHGAAPAINQHVIKLGNMLPPGISAPLRRDFNPDMEGIGAQDLYSQLQQPQDPYANMTVQDWVATVGEDVVDIAIDSLRNQRQLSYKEQLKLERAAERVGLYDENELIQRIGMSLQRSQP